MKIVRALAGAVMLLLATESQGAGQVIQGPRGPVEFIGLQRWDAQELFDAVRELNPGRPFHACAAVMKLDLGFADAAAFLYVGGRSADSERYTVVVGVEEVLARDSSPAARAVATLVLGNFIGDDTSWHALAGSLVDSATRVRTAAQRMLEGLITRDRDPVDWSGARAHVLALFGGTNPFAFGDLLEVLVATGVDPEFGQQLVRESPDLLLAHAGAAHERTREPALAFLRTVSGEDHGADIEAWRAWVRGGLDKPQGRTLR